jgi:hypothetical protein
MCRFAGIVPIEEFAMPNRFSLFIFATLASSVIAFGQFNAEASYQIGYAANLNIGDSVLNMTNSGLQGGFGLTGSPAATTHGNICANVYVFDPQEEEIGCCACLITPNGLNSLSAKADLISNNLTPAVPTSIVIKLVASEPAQDATLAYNTCNPSKVNSTPATVPYPNPNAGVPQGAGSLAAGLRAWGSTLEPSVTPGTFSTVGITYLNNLFLATPAGAVFDEELTQLTTICNFIQANGTGFGICKSCRLGALGGAKQ